MGRPIKTDLDFGDVARLLNLPDGVDPQEPATVAQLTAAIEGINWKAAVRAKTQANINLAAPGSEIDDIELDADDRVLVAVQDDSEENGLYLWNGAAVPMTRAPDANTAAELAGATVSVLEGTASGGTTWRQTATIAALGTDPVTWEVFGAGVPDASEGTKGKVELASQAEVDGDTGGDRVVTSDVLNDWSGRMRKYSGNIGDGAATSYTVTHNFGTRDIVAMIRENSGNYREVEAEVRVNNDNSIDVLFAEAIGNNSHRVIILA